MVYDKSLVDMLRSRILDEDPEKRALKHAVDGPAKSDKPPIWDGLFQPKEWDVDHRLIGFQLVIRISLAPP